MKAEVEPVTANQWTEATVGDLGRIVTGSTPPTARTELYGGTFPFIKPTQLQNCTVCAGEATLTEAGAAFADIAPRGSVLVSCIGNLGKVGLATRDVAFNQQINAIIPKDPDLAKWIFYAVQTPDFLSQLNAVSSATTIAIVNKGKFQKLKIAIPPPEERDRIVIEVETQLSRLEAGVSALKRAQANLKRYRAAVLKAAFDGSEHGTRKPSKSMRLAIGELLVSIDQGWSPKCERDPDEADDQWAVITTTAVQPLAFHPEENKRLPHQLKARENLELKSGDLLITRAGPRSRVGVACLVRRTRPRLMLCDKAYRLRVNSLLATPAYLELMLNTPQLQDEIDVLKTGISDSGVNLTQRGFCDLRVPVPSLEVQECIVSEAERHLSLVEELQATVTANLGRTARLRQSVLQSAFAHNAEQLSR